MSRLGMKIHELSAGRKYEITSRHLKEAINMVFQIVTKLYVWVI